MSKLVLRAMINWGVRHEDGVGQRQYILLIFQPAQASRKVHREATELTG